jgi:hypothetical protein
MSKGAPRWLKIIGIAVGGAVIGAGVRSLLPPFVLDDPFWRDFWSGPPVAGLFAVIAAGVAFFPAYRATLIAQRTLAVAQENATREQWWIRAEWALGQAGSDDEVDREVANDALVALSEQATDMELRMIVRTMENLQASSAVDSAPETAENSRWSKVRRWLPWEN